MSYNTYTTIDAATGIITLGLGGASDGWTMVDDNHSSVSYGSGWGIYTGNPGYMGTEHYSEVTGSIATFTFTGTKGRYYGFKRNDLGYAEISVDNVVKATVDCYSSSAIYNAMLYETDLLAPGTHTLRVRVTGSKNASSSGAEIICDSFEYTSGSSATPTPVRTATPIRTPSPVVTPTAVRTPTPRVTPFPAGSPTPNTATPTQAAGGGYAVTYSIANDWGTGATVNVTIKNNTATAVNGWTLAWTFPGNQAITNMWSATFSQSGASVTAKDAGYNANIPANGGTVSFGFNMNYTGTNAKPASFTLNGAACQIQ